MLKRITVFVSLFALTLICCHSAWARMGAPLMLQNDIAKVDVICTGRLAAIKTANENANGYADIEVTFLVDRPLKGEIQTGAEIIVRYREMAKMPDTVIPPGYVLAVLYRDGDNYVGAHGINSSMPVSEVAYSQYVKSGDVAANVRWEILNSLRSPSSEIVKAALKQTPVLSRTQIDACVIPLASSVDKEIGMAALIGLARANVLDLPLAYLKSHDGTDILHGSAAQLQSAVSCARASAEDIPALVLLMSCKSAELRQAASYLLRELKSSAVLLYLKSALDDPDSVVRYNAVLGLAVYTKDHTGHAPTIKEFSSNEKKYLDYWRTKSIE